MTSDDRCTLRIRCTEQIYISDNDAFHEHAEVTSLKH